MYAHEAVKALKQWAYHCRKTYSTAQAAVMASASEKLASQILAAQKFSFGELRDVERLLPEAGEKRIPYMKFCRMPFPKCWFDGTLEGRKQGFYLEEHPSGLITVDSMDCIEGRLNEYKPPIPVLWESTSYRINLSLTKPLSSHLARIRDAALGGTLFPNRITAFGDEGHEDDCPGWFSTLRVKNFKSPLGEAVSSNIESDVNFVTELLLLMSCRNVKTITRQVSIQGKKGTRKPTMDAFAYHVLAVKLPGKAERYVSLSGLAQHNAKHWRRAHWKLYGVQGRRGLFGKYAGLYFWSAHIAGRGAGEILKDYIIESQEE